MTRKQWRRLWAHDIGVDLGTANTLVYVRGKGIVIDEPSVVALSRQTQAILAVGQEAKAMVGKTPQHIVAARPLIDGVVSDFETTEQMLKYFVQKIHEQHHVFWPRPRVVIGIPSGVTEVEKRAVEEAARSAGARMVYLVEEPVAAAIGCQLPIQEAKGSMIVDIGGGTTEVAILSLGGIVLSRSLRIAGDEFSEHIMQFLRDEFNLAIGESTAELIKMQLGSAYRGKKEGALPVRGRNLVTGLPQEITIGSEHIRPVLVKQVRPIMEMVRQVLEEAPPELVGDIMQSGITLAGGGALLRGLDTLLAQETHIRVKVAPNALSAVVEGAGIILENLETYRSLLITSEEN
jgi:rod shape-determining protein MreB